MDTNTNKEIEAMKEVANDWKFRYLSIFGNITVMKTFMFPKFTHIASIVSNLSAKIVEEIKKIGNQ